MGSSCSAMLLADKALSQVYNRESSEKSLKNAYKGSGGLHILFV